LPPVQLIYGFGFLFKVDESCLGNHLNERKSRFTADGSSVADDQVR
jgi:hypothetical protein